MDVLKNNKIFEEIINLEWNNFINTLTSINRFTLESFDGFCTIEFEEISKQLINLIDPINKYLTKEYCLIGLRIFRKIIEIENVGVEGPSSEWCSKDYEENEKQNKL